MASKASFAIPSNDWIAKLDDFLKLSGRNVLIDAGKISHTEALEKAYVEYEKYRKELENKPSPVEEHFLKVIQEIEENIIDGI